jgi:hypothetical protein
MLALVRSLTEAGSAVRPLADAGWLAGQLRDNRNASTNARAEFVASVLRDAGLDPPARGRLPK